MRLRARVPATSANLGPGFDSLALALDLHNDVIVDADAGSAVTWEGEGADELPTDGSDMVSRAMRLVAEEARIVLPGLALRGVNRIPLERGLGSSAAAAVAGAALAHVLLGLGDEPDPDATYLRARELEGHGDNAAAAVYGGLAIAPPGLPPVRLDPHPDLRPVLLVPERLRMSTEKAREALPPDVPLADAAFNAGHAAMAVVALTERPELLSDALRDRLHEDVRLALVPEAGDLLRRLRGANVPACVSGAGPSILAFDRPGVEVPDPGAGWRAVRVGATRRGVEVRRDPPGDSSLDRM